MGALRPRSFAFAPKKGRGGGREGAPTPKTIHGPFQSGGSVCGLAVVPVQHLSSDSLLHVAPHLRPRRAQPCQRVGANTALFLTCAENVASPWTSSFADAAPDLGAPLAARRLTCSAPRLGAPPPWGRGELGLENGPAPFLVISLDAVMKLLLSMSSVWSWTSVSRLDPASHGDPGQHGHVFASSWRTRRDGE